MKRRSFHNSLIRRQLFIEFISTDLLLCYASGDPHYRNYAGQRFDFQGSCDYVFTKSCKSSIPEFTVNVENERSRWNNRVSITRSVTVFVYGQVRFTFYDLQVFAEQVK